MNTSTFQDRGICFSLFDVLFEGAIREAEVWTKHVRNRNYCLMNFSKKEIDFYEKVRLNNELTLLQIALDYPIRLEYQSFRELHERYLVYVLKKQSDKYHALLKKNKIDIDSDESEYDEKKLVDFFIACYPISSCAEWMR